MIANSWESEVEKRKDGYKGGMTKTAKGLSRAGKVGKGVTMTTDFG